MKTGESLQQASGLVSHLLPTAVRRLPSIMHNRPLQVVGLVVVLIGLLGATIAKLPAEEEGKAESIVGTWQVLATTATTPCNEISPPNCNLGLETFHSDGTLGEVDQFAPPSQQSWGPGVWQANGPNSFDFTEEQLQFDSSGNPIFYDFVWGTITVSKDGQTFIGTWSFASYNFDGTPITTPGYSGTGMAFTGTRMQFQH